MTDHKCARCDRPMHHDTALIDTPCATLLRRHLQDVAKIAGDITLTVAKLARVVRGGGVMVDLGWWKAEDALEAIPLPVDLDAAERHDAAVGELTTWARLIATERGMSIPFGFAVNRAGVVLVRHPLARSAEFVAGHLEWLRHKPFADEAWPALLAACADLQRVVDTAPSRGDIIGLCSCGTARHATDVTCRRCGAAELEHDRAALDAAMASTVLTASEAARWVADMGLVTDTGKLRKLIWAWADRGHLAAVDDTPRYRFGDVLKRVLDSPALLRAA